MDMVLDEFCTNECQKSGGVTKAFFSYRFSGLVGPVLKSGNSAALKKF